MRLGRVVGQVVATRKDPRLEGTRLLLVLPVTDRDGPAGRVVVAVDGVHSREGDLVFYVTAREASFALVGRVVPSDCSIVGKVDAVGGDAKPAWPRPNGAGRPRRREA